MKESKVKVDVNYTIIKLILIKELGAIKAGILLRSFTKEVEEETQKELKDKFFNLNNTNKGVHQLTVYQFKEWLEELSG